VNLICGGTVIKTLKGLGVRVGKLDIRPAGQAARFEIIRQRQNIRITALDGDLKISQGSTKMTVKAGHQLDLACSQCSQEAASAQETGSYGLDVSEKSLCDLSAGMIGQADNSLPFAAAVDGAVAPAMLVWILSSPTPVSPDRL